MLPVISTEPIPKAKIGECLNLLNEVAVESPIRAGDIVVQNICGCNVDIVASRSLN
jgi:CxxC motif-containing protein